MKRMLILAAAVVAGCASTSAVAPYGKDSYILSVADGMGTRSSSDLKVQAALDANAYCAKMGKVMSVRNSTEQGSHWLTATSSGLVFSCLDESDVENKRPNLRKEPDAVIEVRK